VRILLLTGIALAVAAACLTARKQSRLRSRRRQSIRSATERWEDEGGALRARRG
jgi:hypothetical protein